MSHETQREGTDDVTNSRHPHPRLVLGALITAAALAAVVLRTPTPASAHAATGSWSDNDNLCTSASSCVTRGNIVRFWQTIYVEEDAGPYSTCWFVDGVFGPNTADKTEWVQSRLRVSADGWVGQQTWIATERRLEHIPNEDLTFNHYYYNPVRAPYQAILLKKHRTTSVWYFRDKCDGHVWKKLDH
jgi:hypothetical protein